MSVAPDHIGTLRGALSDWLYDPRCTAAPYEAQAAHADAIEAALAECKREGLGDVADDLSRGHGWEDTAACWVWRLPRWGETEGPSLASASKKINEAGIYLFGERIYLHPLCNKIIGEFILDFWPSRQYEQWSITRVGETSITYLKSPEGLALLDTARPKVTP